MPRTSAADVGQSKPLDEWDMEQLLQQLKSASATRIQSALRRVHACATPGPNRLDFLVNAAYSLSARILDQAEGRSELEALAAQVVGYPVTVGLRFVKGSASEESGRKLGGTSRPVVTGKSEVAASSDSERPKKEASRQKAPEILTDSIDAGADPYVRNVMEIFGAQVIRIQTAPERLPGQDGPSSEVEQQE